MNNNQGDYKRDGDILGIYSQGGSGHKQALFAVKSRLTEENPALSFITVDILHDSLPKKLASLLTGGWDKAKAAGDTEKLKHLYRNRVLGVPHHRIIDILVFIPAFLMILRRLYLHPRITRIIDTQTLGTKAIVRAVRLVNAATGRNITVTKVMTDLPSVRAEHFSTPARRLNPKDLACYELATVAPFDAYGNESDEQWVKRQERFWKKSFGLSMSAGNVVYDQFPLRSAFLKQQDASRLMLLKIHCSSDDELLLLKGVSGILQERKGSLFVKIEEEALVGLIALGSQAMRRATKSYLLDMINFAKQSNSCSRPFYLFAACGHHAESKESLFWKVCSLLTEVGPSLPDNFHLIPLAFQEGDTIAALKARADFGIYNPGGLTTMELTSVAKGKLLIHSGAQPPFPLDSTRLKYHLLKGIPLWEAGNAKRLIKDRGAILVTPGRQFRSLFAKLFSSSFPEPLFPLLQQPHFDTEVATLAPSDVKITFSPIAMDDA